MKWVEMTEAQAESLGVVTKSKKNKYGAKKSTINGIEFDSKAEMDYYLLLLSKEQVGEIESFRVQPRYLLQEKFVKNGKTFRPIEYIADFDITYPDGRVEMVDVKGMPETEAFKIKKKMLEHHYPHLHLKVMKYVVKYGGWIELDEYHKLKRKENAIKAKLEMPRVQKRRIR